MGAYVSISACGFGPGQFPSNPDVAGIGIVGVFVGVTCFALAVSTVDVVWQFLKAVGCKSTRSEEEKRRDPDRISFTDILESLVLTCSDQQVFTGAAYALTLRYWQGCKISAYHYNIVGNMMLISCATHLLSVTIVRHYWRYPALAFLRVLCITGVFTVTGLLMVNQNASDAEIRFPTDVPPANATSSLLFLSAACFETDKSPLHDTFKNTTSDAEAFFAKNIRDSAPGNHINGWNWYILLLLYYAAAIVAEGVRFVRRRKGQAGWGGTLARQVSRIIKPRSNLRTLMKYGNIAYLAGGILVSAIAVVNSISYIFKLRNWVARSGWIEEDNGVNPENDWSSFGQLRKLQRSENASM
ncbi:uncharacterized protein PG998_010224 [Apiospora kogelbergensis]|uniref:uncharacterized protein n=1 Tax=Apiospora kogelbergensis TaxID=1337665 RepID=UPI00312DDD0A